MAVSKAQQLAKAKYQQERRTLIAADVSKAKGESYKTKAAQLGISLSRLIQLAIEAYGDENLSVGSRDADLSPVDTNNAPITCKQPEQNLSTEQKQIIEEFNKLPVETQKAFLKLLEPVFTND